MVDQRNVQGTKPPDPPFGDGDWDHAIRSRRRRPPRRLALGCIKLSAAVLVLAVAAAIVLIVRLNVGPLAVDGIGDKIASALHDRVGKDFNFALGQTSIVQHGLGPSLTIDKLTVTGKDGTPILSAPKAEISVDPFALLAGRVVPKRLEVFDVTLRLVLLKNGNLAISAGDGAKPFFEMGRNSDSAGVSPNASGSQRAPAPEASSSPPAAPDRTIPMQQVAAVLGQLMDVLTDEGSVIAAIDRLGIARGTLMIFDEETNQSSTYKDLDLAFDRRHGQTSFSLSAEGATRRWSIDALASGKPGSERHFSLKTKNLSIDEVELVAGARSVGVDTDMPLGAHFDIALNADNSIKTASGGLEAGAGYLRIEDPDFEPLLMNVIDGDFDWNGAAQRIDIKSLRYIEGDTHFAGAGAIVPPRKEGDPWAMKIAMSEPAVLAPDRKGQDPITLKEGAIAGRLMPSQKRLFIDQMSFGTGVGGFAALGQFDWNNGPHLRLGASLSPTPVQIVKRIWPAAVASPVRAWLLKNFERGTIEHAQLKLDYDENDIKRMHSDRAPADRSIDMDFDVSQGQVSFLDGVPPLDAVAGKVHITGRTTNFVVSSANVDANGSKVSLLDGTFSIANANKHPIEAKIAAHLTGSVEAVTNILSRDPLKPYASVPLDPTTLHGRVEGTLDKTIFLGTDDNSGDALKVDAKVSNFTADRLLGKESLEDANLDILVGDGKLKAQGQGKMFGAPTTFEIDRVGVKPPTANVSITLDAAAPGKLGLSVLQGVTGPIVARVATTLGDPAKLKAQVELDLAKAGVNAAFLGLAKPAGRPGKVSFNLAPSPTRMIIDQVVADVGPFQARGTIDLNPDNSFQGAHFSSLKVSPGDDMKLDVTKADDAFKLTIRGTNIDARPFIKAVTSTAPNDPSPTARNAKAEKREADTFKGFDVDMKSSILTGFNKEVMTGAELKLSKRGGSIRQFSVDGNFGSQTVKGSMSANQKIKISTSDAGALVSFIDLYKHMESGKLNAAMRMDGDQLAGDLEIHDFILRNEPAIQRLVAQSTEMSAPGADSAAARRINGGAVRFNRLKVRFEREGSHLELHDATMSGPEIGISVDGWLDYSHDQVDMKGTFVPAFALNNLFSQIPLFGVFLGGKSDEGLLAITFRITGLASTPTLSINPLSAIAPGILRNIFGALDDAANRQQSGVPSR